MIKEFEGHIPRIHPTAFISENTLIIGRVTIASGVSVWPGCVLRGDIDEITVGEGSNLQDGVVVHTSGGLPAVIGRGVTVGHRAVLHGCRISDNCLIGMGAILLDGVSVGENTIIGAGSLVTENKAVPAGSLVMGVPGKVVRGISPDELDRIHRSAREYERLTVAYREERSGAAGGGHGR